MDGILIDGRHCEPDIKGNIIANNRKAGIKIQNEAIAYIGGSCKDDIKTLPDMVPKADNIGQVLMGAEGNVAQMMGPGNVNTDYITKLSVESIAAMKAIHGDSE